MASKYPDSRRTFKRYGLLLSDEQLEAISKKHRILKRDLREDALSDSLPRDLFIDILVQQVLGTAYHWPENRDSLNYWAWFREQFPVKAREKGYRLMKAIWG